MSMQNEASQAQVRAANPTASTWLSANAGSGKTKVLTDRVALLLLEGVAPEQILCLTYTKAAASEMQNRLFGLLGAWAMRDNQALYDDLVQIGFGEAFDPVKLAHARTLFARAIETPGGLKIQTIHSFCSSLLRRFPLESGVSPQFQEIDERQVKELSRDVVETLSRSAEREVIEQLAQFESDHSLDGLIGSILRTRQSAPLGQSRSQIWTSLDLTETADRQSIVERSLLASDLALVKTLLEALPNGGTNDQKVIEPLERVQGLSPTDLRHLQDAVLIASAPYSLRKNFPSKAIRSGVLAHVMPQLEDLFDRVAHSKQMELRLGIAERTAALHAFAAIFLLEYEAQKQLRGWLDFDDLILKTRDLLSNPSVADWVLYRLDGGISHILVDEAQDTSPLQWEVIEKLAQEITSGDGAREDSRTLFVVGDKKQSIYSFQGADAAEFDRMKLKFNDQLALTPTPLNDRSLAYSFRSSSAILETVDAVFKDKAPSGFTPEEDHKAFKDRMPGRVDLWPNVPAVKEAKDEAWYRPVDLPSEHNHNTLLARHIASEIKEMIAQKTPLPVEEGRSGIFTSRPVCAGDFLILVQRRSGMFGEIINACKSIGLPIAGADRLELGQEMAVKDIMAVLSFLATPEDDLSLAILLKSPLFMWSEQRLFTLAHGRRKQYLWQKLRLEPELYEEELALLNDLLSVTDSLRPYDVIERLLTKHKARQRYISVLGPEAEDGINALLQQALVYEQSDIPSLTGFITWSTADDLSIKRQIDNAGDQVRVMTVHGAKGLEAPIVILPDTGKLQAPNRGGLMLHKGLAVVKPSKEAMPDVLQEAQDEANARQQREKDRLLYVAMTRAEKWLIVASAGDLGRDRVTWYDQVSGGLAALGAEDHEFTLGMGKRYVYGAWPDEPQMSEPNDIDDSIAVADWLWHDPTHQPNKKRNINPSQFEGTKALAGEAGEQEERALLRGTQVHYLLERLPAYPEQDWSTKAQSLLEKARLLEDEIPSSPAIEEALNILSDPKLAFIFAKDTLAEVPLSVALPMFDNIPVHGVIDRLIIDNDKIVVVDYKTNRIVPKTKDETPLGLLRQMGAYVMALEALYPESEIVPALLWTATRKLMYLDAKRCIQSLQSLVHS